MRSQGLEKSDLTNSMIRVRIQEDNIAFMLNVASQRPIHVSDAASRVYGTDVVVISPEEGMVRLLNLTATRIWQLADGSRSVDEIATILTDEFEVDFPQAHQAVIRLLTELSEKKLIAWVGA